jgi:chromosome segregation ATPase
LVVGDQIKSEAGIDARPTDGGRLPLRDSCLDLIVCIERFPTLSPELRREFLLEASRVLRDDGVFAAWTPQPDAKVFGRDNEPGSLDFYALEETLSSGFSWVRIMAQMPWQGFSIAAVPDEGDEDLPEPRLGLEEDMLLEAPEASHYLGLAAHERIPEELLIACSLVPIPDDGLFTLSGPDDELLEELERLREELSLRSARSVAAQNRARELEKQLASLRERADEDADANLKELESAMAEARARADAAGEREVELAQQLDALGVERGKLVEKLDQMRERNNHLELDLMKAGEQLEGLQERLGSANRTRDHDFAILTRTVEDQEKALARLGEQVEDAKKSLARSRGERDKLVSKLEAVESERNELRRQVDVAVAEGDASRKFAARLEAELEVVRSRHLEQADRLAERIEEASKLTGEVQVLKTRLAEQESSLQQTRTRAEELSATAAEGLQKGQMLADVARDRDRLREQLSQRARALEELEGKVWEGREHLQREKLENVRLSSEVERLKELLGRARDIEKQRAAEIESLGAELRGVELDRVELKALLRSREERLSQLLTEADAKAESSEEVGALRAQLENRRSEAESLEAKLDKTQHLHRQTAEIAEQRGQELAKVRRKLRALEQVAEERADTAARLQTELDVRQLELKQTKEAYEVSSQAVEELTKERDEANELLRERSSELDRVRSREAELRRRLFELDAAMERLSKAQSEESGASKEVLDMREVLEAATGRGDEASTIRNLPSRPNDMYEALRGQLTDAEAELARLRTGGEGEELNERLAMLALEADVRASEQEIMLAELDAAEQQIWEMTDASDRNAARFAASLAQLEKQKERVDQLLDELEVTRSLLSAEQARTLEQERLLASERAKMARAGLGIEGFPKRDTEAGSELDEVFAELNPSGSKSKMMQLGGPAKSSTEGAPSGLGLDSELARMVDGGAPLRPAPSKPGPPPRSSQTAVPRPVYDRGATGNHPAATGTPPPETKRPRVVVEEVDEDEWEDG